MLAEGDIPPLVRTSPLYVFYPLIDKMHDIFYQPMILLIPSILWLLIALVFVGPQTPWGWIGLLPLVTSVSGFCPAYFPFKFSTIRKKDS